MKILPLNNDEFAEDLAKNSGNYYGKVKSNFVGTEFIMHDKGVKPGATIMNFVLQTRNCVSKSHKTEKLCIKSHNNEKFCVENDAFCSGRGADASRQLAEGVRVDILSALYIHAGD